MNPLIACGKVPETAQYFTGYFQKLGDGLWCYTNKYTNKRHSPGPSLEPKGVGVSGIWTFPLFGCKSNCFTGPCFLSYLIISAFKTTNYIKWSLELMEHELFFKKLLDVTLPLSWGSSASTRAPALLNIVYGVITAKVSTASMLCMV